MPVVASLSALLEANRQFRTHPETSFDIGVWPPECWDYARFRQWFNSCLNDKINRADIRTGRKHTKEYQRNLLMDKRTIQDYLYHRIRHTGGNNLLRTPELQRRYPHINCQWED